MDSCYSSSARCQSVNIFGMPLKASYWGGVCARQRHAWRYETYCHDNYYKGRCKHPFLTFTTWNICSYQMRAIAALAS